MTKPTVRTPYNGVYEGIINPAWGGYWAPTKDPLAEIEDIKEIQQFELVPNFPKLPKEYWSALVLFYFDVCTKLRGRSNLEASVRFLRNENDPSQWKIVVPRQKVTGASVRVDNFNECIDLVTGEAYNTYPLVGWVSAGSSHSHNTMTCSWSAVDDRYELSDPGMHVLVRSMDLTKRTYVAEATIVQRGVRYPVPAKDVIEMECQADLTYHPDVMSYIEIETFPRVTTQSPYFGLTTTKWSSKNKRGPYNGYYDGYDRYDRYDRYYAEEWMDAESWADTYLGPATENVAPVDSVVTEIDIQQTIEEIKDEFYSQAWELLEYGVDMKELMELLKEANKTAISARSKKKKTTK